MLYRRIALLLSFLFLTTACNDDSINKRKMIVIAHHYPSYLSCGLVLETALDLTIFDDALAIEKEGNVTCADYGRDEHNNSIERSCFIKNYDPDNGNDTCVIGVNYTDYAGDVHDLFVSLIGTAEANATK